MRKEIIEKILEEYNVFSCDNSALADRLLDEFSPAGEYIKKEDALKGILAEFTKREEQTIFVCACADVKQTCADILDNLPTYAFPNSDKPEEWVIDFINIKDAELEEIRAEIAEIPKKYPMTADYESGIRETLSIIDKHYGRLIRQKVREQNET